MIHFTSLVAPYAQLAMCFVCANFFLLGMRFTLKERKKKGKEERKENREGEGRKKVPMRISIHDLLSAAHFTMIELPSLALIVVYLAYKF